MDKRLWFYEHNWESSRSKRRFAWLEVCPKGPLSWSWVSCSGGCVVGQLWRVVWMQEQLKEGWWRAGCCWQVVVQGLWCQAFPSLLLARWSLWSQNQYLLHFSFECMVTTFQSLMNAITQSAKVLALQWKWVHQVCFKDTQQPIFESWVGSI